MRRKLGSANIKSFIILAVVVVLVIAIFAYSIAKVLSYDKKIYNVTNESYLYDANYDSIMLKEKGRISQSWDGNYYLTTSNEKYNLGVDAVVYNPNDYRMYAYGNIYQLFDDGTVAKKSRQTEIIRNTAASFYKLADRKYLMIDKEIVDSNKDVYAKNYLVIILDKQGKALLINNETNIKTINSLILKSSSFIFDIANEKLTFNGKKIDLKKIIGSTNEYTEKNDEKGSSNSSTGGSVNVSTGDSTSGESSDKNITQFQKSVSLKTIDPNITYLDVNYAVIDSANYYDSIFLILSDGTNSNRIQLNKDEVTYRIRNLKSNFEYTVSIGYTYIDKENNDSLVEEIQDIVKVRTTKPDYSIAITKVANNKVYFTLKLDYLYKLESGTISLYSDGSKVKSISINGDAATSSNGWQSYIDIDNAGYEILLRLEDAIYNGNSIAVDVQAKYINY